MDAGWLKQWYGLPNQWISTPQGDAEVAGYPYVDKKIRFFKNQTFETNVYKDVFTLSVFVWELGLCPCRERRDGEITVFTGTWSVKGDSVFLHYQWENIYKSDPYASYQYCKESGSHRCPRPHVMSGCAFRREEIGLWLDGKLCFGEATDECYK